MKGVVFWVPNKIRRGKVIKSAKVAWSRGVSWVPKEPEKVQSSLKSISRYP